jgi:hypothetical protein
MPQEPKPFSKLAEGLIASFRRIPGEEPSRMRKRPTREVGAVVEELRIKHRIGRDSPEEAIRERWPDLVGAANAAYSHPVRIEAERRLIVHATHSVVRNELFLHRAEIVGRLQALPGCAGVRELRIRAG